MTNKNRGFNIADALDAPHFQEQSGDGQLPPDPLIPTRVRVTLDTLVPYAGNPRVTQNPNYEDIKESIRNRGLDHAPNVTRKSPDLPYTIKDGGNTRLAILNELWQETGDPRFYELDCMFHPWTNDLDVLVGHMVENEARGSMLFIERAIAAVKIKNKLEEEEQPSLSIRELSRRITSLGWSLDQSALTQLLYAHDRLFPIVPNTFWNGMGRDGVKKIRKILDNARTFWDSVAKPEEGDFDKIWQNAFASIDGDAFEIGEAQNQLEHDIAQHLNVPFMSVRGEIQAISQGVSPGGVRPTNLILDTQVQPASQQGATLNPSGASGAKPNASTNTKSLAQDNKAQRSYASEGDHNYSGADDLSAAGIAAPVAASKMPEEHHVRLGRFTTSELMNHCFEIARDVAAGFGFDSLVVSAASVGFTGLNGFHSGYVLLPERPETPISEYGVFYYLYLHQQSGWFVDNHNNPEFAPVSNHIPRSFLGDEIYWQATQSMLFMRASHCLAWQESHEQGQYIPMLDELDTAIAIISLRSDMGE